MIWLALSAAVIVAIACLWWFAMRQRNRPPSKPTRPYREWKD
jgi:cytoskeletal protein RodZ